MRGFSTWLLLIITIGLLAACVQHSALSDDTFNAETVREWRDQADAQIPAVLEGAGEQPIADITASEEVPGFITKFEITVKTSNVGNSSTDAHIWLLVSVDDVVDSGSTTGSMVFLGTGAGQGSSKTFTISNPRGDFNQQRAGGLSLVNGMNGGSADWSVDSVRVVGIDTRGVRWLIANYTIPSAQAYRRWLRNDPNIKHQGPALPIPTKRNWQHL